LLEPLDRAPVAVPAGGLVVPAAGAGGALVRLDATQSTDADSDPLTYRWTGAFPEGNGVVTGATPNVTLPIGVSTFTLTANDGEMDSAPVAASVTVSDFLLALNNPAASLKRGASTNIAVAVAPRFGAYNAAVTLACGNLPAGVTCSFSPATITPGATGATATLTITASPVARLLAPRSPHGSRSLLAFWFATLSPFGMTWIAGLKRNRARVALIALLLLLLVLVACGGGGVNSASSSQQSTPAASTTTITITGTSSDLQRSVTVPLTVQ
jgi:hypothetical protein